MRHLLSTTFPHGFRISKNIGHPTSGNGGKKMFKRYLKSEHTNKHTDTQMDILTYRKHRPRGPMFWKRRTCVTKVRVFSHILSQKLYSFETFEEKLHISLPNWKFAHLLRIYFNLYQKLLLACKDPEVQKSSTCNQWPSKTWGSWDLSKMFHSCCPMSKNFYCCGYTLFLR